MNAVQLTAAVIGALLAGTILLLVRRTHLHGSYALWWFAVAGAILVLGVFPPAIDWLGHVTGIHYRGKLYALTASTSGSALVPSAA